MNFKPVKKTSLSDYVVSQIKGMIVRSEIKVGEKLPNERDLSTMFDVSRSSVREALRVLELQGLLLRNNSGTYVQTNFSEVIGESLTLQLLMNSATYEDIQQTRVMLERELIKSATVQCSEDSLEKISKEIDKMERAIKAKDKELYISADIAFHSEIAKSANNSVLLFLYNTISALIFKVQKRVAFDDDVLKTSLDYHKEIYSAIKERDVVAAESKLVEHLLDVENRIHKLNEMDKIVQEEFNNIN
jgi:GntR family transcriptional regulator, transcriptional repressor for pyruvate dehydrogenase complex